ncbi:MAG: hypothetical protein WHT46_07620 [Candidatus Geothermincolales bacterium]
MSLESPTKGPRPFPGRRGSKGKNGFPYRKRSIRRAPFALLAVVILGLALSSCGGEEKGSPSTAGEVKLPPGITEESLTSTTNVDGKLSQSDNGTSSAGSQAQAEPLLVLALEGLEARVIKVTRRTDNQVAVSGNERSVEGDFLEIELSLKNASAGVLDLSEFSFRLRSDGITASSYDDYYGQEGRFGLYVSAHTISASPMDYSDLAKVNYKLKAGEEIGDVFLLFDLNPTSTAVNQAVNADNTYLIVHKVSGEGAGKSSKVSMSGLF